MDTYGTCQKWQVSIFMCAGKEAAEDDLKEEYHGER